MVTVFGDNGLCHAPFVSENEIREHVFDLIRQNKGDQFYVANRDNHGTKKPETELISFKRAAVDAIDQCFGDAVTFVKETKKASISSIQRRFKIGYGRAANIIDEMERQGVVGKRESQNGNRVVFEV